jgi:hypothetical protein
MFINTNFYPRGWTNDFKTAKYEIYVKPILRFTMTLGENSISTP